MEETLKNLQKFNLLDQIKQKLNWTIWTTFSTFKKIHSYEKKLQGNSWEHPIRIDNPLLFRSGLNKIDVF